MSREFDIDTNKSQEDLGRELIKKAKDFAISVEQENFEVSAVFGENIRITVEVTIERVEDE